MIVASLLDAGADSDAVREGLAKLNLDGYSLCIEPMTKQGFAATRFQVRLGDPARQPARGLQDIVALLEASSLPAAVTDKATRIFERLAQAEAKVHGTTVEKVHFHEVGAVDAILDIVGAVLALESLGVQRVVCSPVPVGCGTVICDHGVLPVPAPATAELLRGVATAPSDEVGELTTPTAAAVLTTLASDFGPMPSMTISSIGYGAGAREGAKLPNLLRVLVGRVSGDGEVDEISMLETNLDDASPELVAHCMERALDAGALDAYALPIHMKKSRSGVVLTVLCRPEHVPAMERLLFTETPTFGVRRHTVTRAKMRRRHETVNTPYGDVRIKVGEHEGIVTASPEYEDCRAAAVKHGIALREVIAAANAAWSAKSST
jgi:uncharacterized protein (TIGR00299 family) protein